MICLSKILIPPAIIPEINGGRGRCPSGAPAGRGTISDELRHNTDAAAPLVVWNITSRCNMSCQHCYIWILDKKIFKEELTTLEAKHLVNSLARMQVKVVLFSGGEPLLRDDLLQVASWAKEKGMRIGLSTNGTLITKKKAKALKQTGFDYIGISLDGTELAHDQFRNMPGAFDQAMRGVINSLEAGLKTGLRYTITRLNRECLPQVLDLAVKEQVQRFCLYHLVYSGRGRTIYKHDLSHGQRRSVLEELIKKTLELNGRGMEIITTDNHADGVYLYKYVVGNYPERAETVKTLLKSQGGCSAGTKIANIDSQGFIHPCQFWQHRNLGNIREKDLADIWQDKYGAFMCQLRAKTDHLKGRCGRCHYNHLCGGCRVRAEFTHNDIWQEDPACYLTEEEISV